MKHVGVREFRDHATRYLAGEEVLAIERHGEVVGYYIPARNKRQRDRAASMMRLERAIERVLAETGLTEEELARFFDPNEPVPDLEPVQADAVVGAAHAAGD